MSNAIEGGISSVQNGCNTCISSWLDRYDAIEEDVRSSGQYSTESTIKQEASKRFMFNIYVPDVNSIRSEWRGDEKISHKDPYGLTPDGVMVSYGGRVEKFEDIFIERPLKKGMISMEEAETLRLAVNTIQLTDIKEIRFLVHNIEPTGERIRYESRWEKRGKTIIPTMHKLPEAQDASIARARDLMKQRTPSTFQEISPKPGVYILSHIDTGSPVLRREFLSTEAYGVDRTTRLLREDAAFQRQVESSPPRDFSTVSYQKNSLINDIKDDFIAVSRRAVSDTAETVRDIAIFVRHKQQRRETNAHSMVRKEERQSERLTLKKIREKPVRIVEVIEKRHVEMRKKVALLGVIAETGVAVHAVPVFLAALAEKLPPAVGAVEKSLRRHRKREAKREARRSRAKVPRLQTERMEPLRTAKEGKKRKKSSKRYEARKPLRRKEFRPTRERRYLKNKEPSVKYEMRPKKERRRMAERKKKATAEPIRLARKEKQRVRRILMRAIREIRVIGERPRTKRKEKKWRSETRYVFAWAVWWLVTRKDQRLPSVKEKKIKQEVLPQRETMQWILLSIIWYLAMIRESGRGSKRYQPLLPVQACLPARQGVIFVANS